MDLSTGSQGSCLPLLAKSPVCHPFSLNDPLRGRPSPGAYHAGVQGGYGRVRQKMKWKSFMRLFLHDAPEEVFLGAD